MQLDITGLMAMITEFKPVVPTHVIQIISTYSQSGDSRLYDKAVENPMYVSKRRYVFDDVWPGLHERDTGLITPVISGTIISDFVEAREAGCEGLVVHCTRGINRSPAVGMALNRIFELGYDQREMRQKFPEFTHYVYRIILEEGARRGIGPGFDVEFERQFAFDAAAKNTMMQGFARRSS